jgi:hypothetical protein
LLTIDERNAKDNVLFRSVEEKDEEEKFTLMGQSLVVFGMSEEKTDRETEGKKKERKKERTRCTSREEKGTDST